ncbi:UNVERIFIED_CONTAM: hypothetical protein HHA_222420 [Hammondia hammondi]|eukprot:XP_008886186.1 hypothetical protein HHA_222420 [Hammondia hammondi]
MQHQQRPETVHIGGDRSPIPQMFTPMPSKSYSFADKPSVSRVVCAGPHADTVSGIAHRMHAAEHYQFRISGTCVILTILNLYVLLERLGLKKVNLILQLGYLAVALRALPAVCCAYMCWTRMPSAGKLFRNQDKRNEEKRLEQRGGSATENMRAFSWRGDSRANHLVEPEHQLLLKHLSPTGLEIVVESERRHRSFSLCATGALLLLACSDLCQGYSDMWPLLHLEKGGLLAQTAERPPLFGPSPPGVAREGFAVYPPELKARPSSFATLAAPSALVLAPLFQAAAAFCLLKAVNIQNGSGDSQKGKQVGNSRMSLPTAREAAKEKALRRDNGDFRDAENEGSARDSWRGSKSFFLHAFFQAPLCLLCYLILVHWPSLHPSRPRPVHAAFASRGVAACVDWIVRLSTVVTLAVFSQGWTCCLSRAVLPFLEAKREQKKQPVFVRKPSRVLLILALLLLLFSVAVHALTAFLPYVQGLENVSYIWGVLSRASMEERVVVCVGLASHFFALFLIACSGTSFGIKNHLVSSALRGEAIDEDSELYSASPASPPTLLVEGKPVACRADGAEGVGTRAKSD